jgi:hypothetical protein
MDLSDASEKIPSGTTGKEAVVAFLKAIFELAEEDFEESHIGEPFSGRGSKSTPLPYIREAHAVAQLIAALRYKSESRGFD